MSAATSAASSAAALDVVVAAARAVDDGRGREAFDELDDQHFTAIRLDEIRTYDLVSPIISALGEEIGRQRTDELGRCFLLEDYHRVDRA